MSAHFCKVGKIKPNLSKVLGLDELERMYKKIIEEAYNLIQTDAGLSDILYHEASKLRKNILVLQNNQSKEFDAAF